MKRKLYIALLLGSMSVAAQAAQFGPLSLSGFFKYEEGVANNVGTTYNNHSMPTQCYGDSREILPNKGQGKDCWPTGVGTVTTPSPMLQVTAAVRHEFDNAVKIEGVVTRRIRNGSEDVVGQNWYEKYVGISYPSLGSLKLGTQMARAWSRQDGFSYPIGLSTAWSETGAGFGFFPDALRYTSRMLYLPFGKLTLEATYATGHANNIAYDPVSNGPNQSTVPRMLELFAQFSNHNNLIEFTYENSHGAGQSSWGKNAFVGATNLPALIVNGTDYYSSTPRQSVAILEGDHWFNPLWMLTWGVRHSYWSGSAIQCGYDPVHGYCTYPSGGFNYTQMTYKGQTYWPGYSASENDFLLGLSHYHGLWTYTAGMVYLGRARTDNPSNWGQDNWAVITNLGIYRKVPEIYRTLSVYGGLGYVHFGHLGPAPMSMPSNSQFSGINSMVSRSGETFTLGALLTF